MGKARKTRRSQGRPPEREKQARLRARVLQYVLARGLEDLSLRPLAAALGTSARMLVYHFGSRERLLRAVVTDLRRMENERIRRWWENSDGQRRLSDFVRWYWQRLGSSRAAPAARVIFEVYAMALRDPSRFRGVLTDPVAYWTRLARDAGESGEAADAKATLALATMRGLLLDRLASGDRRRIAAALHLLVESLAQRA